MGKPKINKIIQRIHKQSTRLEISTEYPQGGFEVVSDCRCFFHFELAVPAFACVPSPVAASCRGGRRVGGSRTPGRGKEPPAAGGSQWRTRNRQGDKRKARTKSNMRQALTARESSPILAGLTVWPKLLVAATRVDPPVGGQLTPSGSRRPNS